MFDWDEANIQHIARHDITPNEAEYVLINEPQHLENQTSEDEERILEVGLTQAGRCLVVLATWRGNRQRVVTAFDAPKH